MAISDSTKETMAVLFKQSSEALRHITMFDQAFVVCLWLVSEHVTLHLTTVFDRQIVYADSVGKLLYIYIYIYIYSRRYLAQRTI